MTSRTSINWTFEVKVIASVSGGGFSSSECCVSIFHCDDDHGGESELHRISWKGKITGHFGERIIAF